MFNLTPFLRLYAAYRSKQLFRLSPVQAQERELSTLVKKAANTKFGLQHNFSRISCVADYQNAVPLRTYEEFWNDYWKSGYPVLTNCTWPGTIPYFPVSSGTTSGTTKYIPCSQEMIQSNNKAGVDMLIYHVTNRPNSQILGGKSFMLGGSTDLSEASPGVFVGDLSGIAVKAMPWWARLRYFPPAELALLKNWEEKIDRLSKECLVEDIRMISGVPSWLLIFFDRMKQLIPESAGKLNGLFKNLELIIHGGVNFSPYQEQFQKLLDGSNAELREVYPASEGFIATADRGSGEGLRLNLDHGIFFEFVPLEELGSPNPTRHWIKNVQKDVNYAVIMTTCAGLWSYIIGDTVRFVDLNPARVLVTGRTKYYLSAFGEHLIAEELERAVAEGASKIHATISDYAVGPLYPEPGGLGGHIYFVEFNKEISGQDLEHFSQIVDLELCRLNEDYEAHRAKGFGLKPPTVLPVKHGAFAAWMKSRGKLGGQNKVPRIITDKDLLDHITGFMREQRT